MTLIDTGVTTLGSSAVRNDITRDPIEPFKPGIYIAEDLTIIYVQDDDLRIIGNLYAHRPIPNDEGNDFIVFSLDVEVEGDNIGRRVRDEIQKTMRIPLSLTGVIEPHRVMEGNYSPTGPACTREHYFGPTDRQMILSGTQMRQVEKGELLVFDTGDSLGSAGLYVSAPIKHIGRKGDCGPAQRDLLNTSLVLIQSSLRNGGVLRYC